MSNSNLKVRLCQILVGNDKQANIAKASNLIDQSGDEQLVVSYPYFISRC
jgi:predicted amidohydrolase